MIQTLGSLTPREQEVLALVARGKANKQIAAELGIKPCTVKGHMESIFKKLEIQSRTAAAIWFDRVKR